MAQGVVNFKVFLYENEKNVECRRMAIDAEVSSSFVYLREKLETVFPLLRNVTYKITWIDNEDDAITISSDDDLVMAILDMSGNMKVLHVHAEEGESSGTGPQEQQCPPQSRITCDVCQKLITHYRYKCLQCPDYDLCADCEQLGHHSEHIMLRCSKPTLPGCISRIMMQLTRSMHRSQVHAFKDMFKNERHRRHGSFSGKGGRGKHHGKEKRECPFGDLPMFFNFEKLSNVILSTLDQVTNPQPENRSAEGSANNQTTEAQNQPQAPNVNIPSNASTASTSTQEPQNKESQPNVSTSKSSSGFSTPRESLYPTVMETDPASKPAEAGWTFVQPQTSTETAPSAPVPQRKPEIAEGVRKLTEIGFKDEEMLVKLLEKYDGNVSMVIRHILDFMN